MSGDLPPRPTASPSKRGPDGSPDGTPASQRPNQPGSKVIMNILVRRGDFHMQFKEQLPFIENPGKNGHCKG